MQISSWFSYETWFENHLGVHRGHSMANLSLQLSNIDRMIEYLAIIGDLWRQTAKSGAINDRWATRRLQLGESINLQGPRESKSERMEIESCDVSKGVYLLRLGALAGKKRLTVSRIAGANNITSPLCGAVELLSLHES
jgi:hypothetical protein